MSDLQVLCIGDPHIKYTNIPRSKEMIESVISLVKERKPDIVVVMGDTLDRFEDVKTTALCLAVDFIDRLSKLVKVYLLIGNHDYPNPNVFMNAPHPFTALHRWDSVVVVDKVITHNISGHDLTFVPYVCTGRFVEALNTTDNWINSKVIFAHQEFQGCQMGAITSINGDVWDTSFPEVVSGHIHDYQQCQNNILYIGCPIQHTYGDTNIKTVSMLCINDHGYNEERISLNVKSMKLIHIEALDIMNLIIDKNELIKVIIHGTVADNTSVKKLSIIKELKDNGSKVVFKDRKEVTTRIRINNDNEIRYGDVFYEEVKDTDMGEMYTSIFHRN